MLHFTSWYILNISLKTGLVDCCFVTQDRKLFFPKRASLDNRLWEIERCCKKVYQGCSCLASFIFLSQFWHFLEIWPGVFWTAFWCLCWKSHRCWQQTSEPLVYYLTRPIIIRWANISYGKSVTYIAQDNVPIPMSFVCKQINWNVFCKWIYY